MAVVSHLKRSLIMIYTNPLIASAKQIDLKTLKGLFEQKE